jgi:hypothetical protein
MSLDDELAELTTVAELQEALKRAHRQVRKYKAQSDEIVEAVYRAAKDAARATPAGKAVALPRDKRKGKAEVALVHATDWQLGKKSVSYGMETCAKRMEQLVKKVIQITDIQRAHHPVRECVLLLGGDMVEGIDIFPGQAWEIEAHLFEQLFETSRIIETMVRTLGDNFEKLRVVCEYGNHGRIGRYGVSPKGDNIDLFAYRVARDRTKGVWDDWQMSEAWYQIFEIGKYRGLLVHGDEVKSFGGNTPLFGIMRKVNSWAAGVIEPFTDAYMGHWHTPHSATLANGGRVFVTGSPESHNEYAREFVAATSRPSQRLHFIDPEKGRVASEYVVWLD